jgi:nucleotidyltransferase substrate binding protein (TIGR01987 family)
MQLNTIHLENCLEVLEYSYDALNKANKNSTSYKVFRNAALKGFELTLEVTSKLLKKALKPFFASSKAVDRLTFKEVFRNAAKHGLITIEGTERWFDYRDNRNTTTHDYDEDAAEEALALIAPFINDVKTIIESINHVKT